MNGSTSPIASLGTTLGRGGGLGAPGDTIYAFQGSIAGLAAGAAGAITVETWLAAINAGGALAGDTPANVTMQSFGLDNALYTGSRSAADIAAFKAAVLDNANWTLHDTTAFPLFGGSFFV